MSFLTTQTIHHRQSVQWVNNKTTHKNKTICMALHTYTCIKFKSTIIMSSAVRRNYDACESVIDSCIIMRMVLSESTAKLSRTESTGSTTKLVQWLNSEQPSQRLNWVREEVTSETACTFVFGVVHVMYMHLQWHCEYVDLLGEQDTCGNEQE